jgi:hypothetical protein
MLPILSLLFTNSVSRVQGSVDLVDDTIVGKDINFDSLGIVELDPGVADRDFDSSTLKSVNSETARQLTRDKHAREDVVQKEFR